MARRTRASPKAQVASASNEGDLKARTRAKTAGKGTSTTLSKAPHRRSSKPVGSRDEGRQTDQVAKTSFPVVGIGASAGGLEAFRHLLEHLSVDTGMAFVLVQHLDPQHQSALPHLLTRATCMPVSEVTNNQRVEADHIYVIPPNTSMSIAKGLLILRPRQDHGHTPHYPIDMFLESLAADQRERAIGVILSGTGSDGTLGLEAIKAEGGITFAQDESAKYDSMPRSAVAAGCVDFILSPENIGKELARIAKHPYIAGQPPGVFSSAEEERAYAIEHADYGPPLPSGGTGTPPTGPKRLPAKARASRGKIGENGFNKILLLLRNHSGVDFTFYKSNTMRRRISRRMVLNKRDTLADYANFLRGNTKELDVLYSDALISVTSFFRNPEAFDVLKRKVLPKLLKERGDEPLRVWVVGCSTGQEAYSIAMAFVESGGEASRIRKPQIFATDLNDALLEKARQGLYAKSLAQDVAPERLRRFFVEEEGGYRVTKPLREIVVFARQNLLSDPPFSRMDLISCRNLLIYLEPTLQKKAISTFHYALKRQGYLLLGSSESIAGCTSLFEPVDKKYKLYSKKAPPTPSFHLPVKTDRGRQPSPGSQQPSQIPMGKGHGEELAGFRAELNAQREADRVTVSQFAPPSVLINAELQILQFRGPTGAYLKPPTGKASFDLLKMAREGLMLPLRAAIKKAKKENKTALKENLRVVQNGETSRVNIEVIPLKNLREPCFLVLFEEAEKARSPSTVQSRSLRSGTANPARGGSKREESRRVADLERELAETRDYLQAIQEQYEAANKELQASNEEVQSANEELQSINEELETSKEELESTNEELTTVNEEMANRNAELIRLTSDLTNLQTSTRLAILLLGRDLTIRRFSAQAEKQFNLLAADVGRPIGSLRHNLKLPGLETLVSEVIDTVLERECEVQDTAGRWYSLRVRPYLTSDNKVDGAVLLLVDINALRQSEAAIRDALDYAEAIVRTTPNPFLILNADLRVHKANESFYRTFKVSPPDTEGRLIYDLGNRQWNIPELRELLEGILPRHRFFNDLEVTRDFETIGRRTMLLNARQLSETSDQPVRILLGIQDVTELLSFQAEMRRSELRYRRLFEAAKDGVLLIDPTTRKILDANPFMTQLLGYAREELLGKELFEIGLLKDENASRAAFQELQAQGFVRYDDLPLETKAGERREVEIVGNLYDEDGKTIVQCNIRDITERERAEGARARLAAIVESSDDAIVSKDLNGIITSWNAGAERLFGYTAQEVVGRSVTVLIPSERLYEETAILEQICRGERVEHFETIRRCKDGRLLDVSLTISPIVDSQGHIVGASKIARDITARKETEEALRQSHAELRLHAEELIRFNRVAVGRELRMIELKKEINEVCQRHGEDARYPLEFEQDNEDTETEYSHHGTNPREIHTCGERVAFSSEEEGDS